MIFIRSLLFHVLFYAMFIVLAGLGSPTLLMPRAASLWVARTWAKASIALLGLVCGAKVEFRNLHLVPKGASILASKHQSVIETFAIITVLDDFSYILKKELTKIPLFGWYVKATDQIAIDRKRRGAVMSQLREAVSEKLAAGRQIVIFPEGTRQPVGVPAAYKSGISALCSTNDVPCTPVALNTGLFWPRGGFLRPPGRVIIEFLPPIPPTLGKAEFMHRLETTIETATNALVEEARRLNPGLRCTGADEPATA